MEQNISLPYLLYAGLFAAHAVVQQLHCNTDLIDKSTLLPGSLPALFAFLFRFPYLNISRCFYDAPGCYTPEKPVCRCASKVPTYSWASIMGGKVDGKT
jgi:hypothetical protein